MTVTTQTRRYGTGCKARESPVFWGMCAPPCGSLTAVTAFGRQDGDHLTADLRGARIDTWADLWDALSGPCGLPPWFGRNLDAWWDTIQTGVISDVLDDHSFLIIRVSPTGLFAPGQPDGGRFLATTNQSDYARVDIEDG